MILLALKARGRELMLHQTTPSEGPRYDFLSVSVIVRAKTVAWASAHPSKCRIAEGTDVPQLWIDAACFEITAAELKQIVAAVPDLHATMPAPPREVA